MPPSLEDGDDQIRQGLGGNIPGKAEGNWGIRDLSFLSLDSDLICPTPVKL